MASVYTTKRGKNKKGKLGQRKDASNNAANKLSQKIFADNPLESFLLDRDLAPKSLGSSATARNRAALENARAKLNLLLTGSCGNPECKNKQEGNTQLLLCQGCRSKAYCNADCQRADWKSHKPACKEAQAKKAAEKEGKSADAATSSSAAPAAAPAANAASPTESVTPATPDTPAAVSTPSTSAPASTSAPPPAVTSPVTDPSALD